MRVAEENFIRDSDHEKTGCCPASFVHGVDLRSAHTDTQSIPRPHN